jgi:DNA-directed RNA polymerase specialized sigma24 family protein
MATRSDPPLRGLTADGLARLLARLDHDPERAGVAYEDLRHTLVKFFDWRGAIRPDECADETLDRLARRLGEGTPVDVPRGFARGIARLVLLESWRSPEARARRASESELARLPAPETIGTPDAEPRAPCLRRCLDELSPEARRLILGYYSAEGRTRIEARRRMAETLELTETALRSRAQRIRERLESCIGRCLGPRSDAK